MVFRCFLRFKEYFKVDDAATRQKVSDRLTKVAAECNSGDALARLSCVDGASSCSSRVLAYTQPSTGYMANCNLYFTALEAMPKRCHGQDQATTTLHEMTHVRAVYAPNTVDNAYGYAASSKLSSRQALLNANTFELYTSGMSSHSLRNASSWLSTANRSLCIDRYRIEL